MIFSFRHAEIEHSKIKSFLANTPIINTMIFSCREAIYRIKKLILRLITRTYWRRCYIADISESTIRILDIIPVRNHPRRLQDYTRARLDTNTPLLYIEHAQINIKISSTIETITFIIRKIIPRVLIRESVLHVTLCTHEKAPLHFFLFIKSP